MQTGGGRDHIGVLVVDDDEVVRLTMVALLDVDYHVVDVPDAQQALAAFAQDPTLQIVVTDLVMPDVDGRQLLRSLTRFGRPFSGVIVTGMRDYLATESDGENTIEQVLHAVLLKPYDPEELRLAVDRAKSFVEMRTAFNEVNAAAWRDSTKGASR